MLLEYYPAPPLADGTSIYTIAALVVDKEGKPVPDEQVRFVGHAYAIDHVSQKIISDPHEQTPGGSASIIRSGGYVQEGGRFVSNLYTARTDTNGYAYAHYRSPNWQDFMAEKSLDVGVWYHVDGGYNPYVSTNVWFGKPETGQ